MIMSKEAVLLPIYVTKVNVCIFYCVVLKWQAEKHTVLFCSTTPLHNNIYFKRRRITLNQATSHVCSIYFNQTTLAALNLQDSLTSSYLTVHGNKIIFSKQILPHLSIE